MSIEFESYGDFEDWCAESGYNPDKEVDLTESAHKRDILRSFYIENSVDRTFAHVTLIASHDYGWSDIEVTEGLTRKVTQVMTEKVEYV